MSQTITVIEFKSSVNHSPKTISLCKTLNRSH